MAGGRPTKFNKVDWKLAKRMYLRGFTDKDVCKAIDVEISTLTKWKQKYPEFFTSLKDWKAEADNDVEMALYERALGYSHPDVKLFQNDGEIISEEIIKHYPPDPTSMIFWLKNRKPEQWRDKQEHSFEGIDKLLAEIRNDKSKQ